jgi:hypothetical protein
MNELLFISAEFLQKIFTRTTDICTIFSEGHGIVSSFP